MRATLDCEAKYAEEEDPWGIGDADSPRYDLYVEWIRSRAHARQSILDVGCGFGAMLARLRSDFDHLHGIELSADAIAKGTERFPFIDFEQGSIDALERTHADGDRFDAIIFSDVMYYVDEVGKRASLRWIAEHLNRDGFAFIALYSPGDQECPTPREVCTLVSREFVVERRELLDSEHLMLLVRPRRRLAALTLDYETWQPIPAGRRIDWDADVFAPTDALLDACDAEGARLTIFAELGEHAFLREQDPRIAARMEAQWLDAVQRGHDVQMHIHPNWLPELGARFEDGRYLWNGLLTRAADHPDLVGLIERMKRVLEEAIQPDCPFYRVVAFRAGGYEAQPFRALAEALLANELWCDSSVYHGGRQPGVYHDYSCPFNEHQPWFASHVDPQLQAPPAERGIVELPVATFARNDRWTFDTEEGGRFGDRLIAAIEAERTAGQDTEMTRRITKVRRAGSSVYQALGRRRLVNQVLPRRVADALVGYVGERVVEDDFHVAVGHSKADLDIPAIRQQLRVLREAGVEVIGLAEMAQLARDQLERHASPEVDGETLMDVRRDSGGAVDYQRDDVRARQLEGVIPLDRTNVLDLDCGADGRSAAIASEHRLPYPDGAFDCICAVDALERAVDIDAVLAEAHRVLADGGLLLAAIPPDAYNTRRMTRSHAWRTTPEDVRERLGHAGFLDVSVEEIDAYRLGAAPYPPALGRVLLVRAWRRAEPLAPVERVDALGRWAHGRVDRHLPSGSVEPVAGLQGGRASSAEMTRVLGEALSREGFEPRWVTMIAHDHPHGYGPRLCQRHEVIELTLADHSVHVLDPISAVRFPFTLQALIDDATLADGVERERDGLYLAQEQDLYSTSFWYRRVVAVSVRSRPRGRHRFVPARWAGRAADRRRQAVAFARVQGWRAIRRLQPP